MVQVFPDQIRDSALEERALARLCAGAISALSLMLLLGELWARLRVCPGFVLENLALPLPGCLKVYTERRAWQNCGDRSSHG
jgi:hypothetical protein